MKLSRMDTKLLSVKIHYFLINGAHAGVIPFIPVYAEQLGVSASAIGIILAVLSCLTVITKTAFGSIVDRFQNLKQMILFLILMDSAADLGLNFIPKPYQAPINTTGGDVLCYQGKSFFLAYSELNCQTDSNLTTRCTTSCSQCQRENINCGVGNGTNFNFSNSYAFEIGNRTSEIFKYCLQENLSCTDACFDGSELCKSVSSSNPPLQLCLLSIFITSVYISLGSIVSLSDAACYNALGDQPQKYGKQRLWGTVGWGLFGLLIGYLNQVFTGTSKIFNYSSGFYMLVLLFAIDLVVIPTLHLKDVTLSKNIYKDVGTLLVKPKILFFIATVYGIGIVTGMARSYSFWYLRTTLGANQLVLGCSAGIQCFLGELPFFFFSGLIINKLGHLNTFTMSFVAYGVRFFTISFLTNPWWALTAEVLQGPCFGSFYSAMTSYSKLVSPKGTEATMQGIMSGTFEGLGAATGSLLGGFCISTYGGRKTFYWTGILSLIFGLIHWLAQVIWKYAGRKQFAESM